MRTSAELKNFVDSHNLKASKYALSTDKKKFDFVASLFRTGENALFVAICDSVKIQKDKITVTHFVSLFHSTLLVFTNKRLIVTYFSVPKKEPKYETFDFEYSKNGEQNWDIIEAKAGALKDIMIRFDNGVEIRISVDPKKSQYLNAEIRRFLNSFDEN